MTRYLIVALFVFAASATLGSQVSGWIEPAALAPQPTPEQIYGPVNDTQHAGHYCPAGHSPSDCWWTWHCCLDRDGDPVQPHMDLCLAGATASCEACEAACAIGPTQPGCSQPCNKRECGKSQDVVRSGGSAQCPGWKAGTVHAPISIRPGAVQEYRALFPNG